MIDGLVPTTVVTVTTGADLLETELFAEEERALGTAVAKRRREFVTGRACAHRALERLGLVPTPIACGAHGEPLWPAGVVGSITHCERYRACAVARAQDVRSLGIDAEPHAPIATDVLEAIASAQERRALAAHGSGVCWDRLLFSAKEAVFKAWYPLTRRGLAFDDVDVRIDRRGGTFRADVLVADGEPAEFHGRWRVAGGIVAAAVVVAW